MLLLSVFRTMQALAVLGLLEALVFFASGYDLSFILRPAAQLLWAAVAPQLAVLAVWNLADWTRRAHDGYVERQYQRDADAVERYMEAERASAAFMAQAEPGLLALRRAMLAGTYSVNGRRYPGALVNGRQEVIAGQVSVGCAVCGVKLDIDRCRPNVAYVCAACSKGL